MNGKYSVPSLAGLLCAILSATVVAGPTVVESSRQVPVAANVDVVIVGGGTGAVSAAVSAAGSGAKVFLVAPRPYLGEDICGPMRLWLEPGEEPTSELGRKLFMMEKGLEFQPGTIAFRYEASLPSAAKHKDTDPPSRLNDGVLGTAAANSVQYDGDVAIIADLRAVQEIKAAQLLLFYRENDFAAGSVVAETSNDKRQWTVAGTFKCDAVVGERVVVTLPLNTRARFVRLSVKRANGCERLLLGEIAFSGPAPEPAVTPRDASKRLGPFRPMHVKKTLDDALLGAKVQFLYGSIVTDVLRDGKGNLAGVVIGNRAGRQAVLAKTIIDATDRAWTARLAGASFEPYPSGTAEFRFVTVGGKLKNGDGFTSASTGLAYPVQPSPKTAPKKGDNTPPKTSAELIEYTFKLPMTDGSFASLAAVEQRVRDLVWDDSIVFTTDELFQVPPDALKARKRATDAWAGADKLDLDAFRPAGVDRLWVLGGCADVTRESAAKLVRPANQIDIGQRIGAAAAAEATQLAAPTAANTTVAGVATDEKPTATVGEMLGGLRPLEKAEASVSSPQRALSVLGEYDVVVVGGGTGGAPAGIAAARAKARTLVIENLHALGGVGTTGMISTYYHGYRGGFTATLPGGSTWDPVDRAEWWRAELRKAGADLWFGCTGAGSLVENGRVKGMVVTTPQGRGIVLAKVVIDATGNSDIAATAGAQTVFMDPSEPAFQGTGLPPLALGKQYTNTDFTIVDETDMMDVWHLMAYAKRKYTGAFDLGQLIDTRERRRIVGDFTMTLADAINRRTYPDTIHIASSDFDTHGFTVDPYLLLEHPQKKEVRVNVPFRCLLPKGIDGVLVIGLGISAHRDVMPLLRMQPDIQNQGYAAGLIAATAAKTGRALRELDLRPLQEQLAEMDILPRPMVGTKDSYPLSDEQIASAVAQVRDGTGMSVIVTHQEKAMPLLRQAYAVATSAQDKLAYARTLAVLGDATGLETVIAAVEAQPKWDRGWNYTGMGQFGHALSELDNLIVAIGRTRDKRALPAILKKAALLDASAEFSHHRAVALALELIGDPSAAGPLADLLAKPGMTGHVTTTVDDAAQRSGSNANDNTTRATSIREISLARALYHCGDKDGLGRKILEQYTHDLRGYLAGHARTVLAKK
ncbi:MAG: FAD-dependent oxidoreductase [Tepidisphaerales bacterium]